MSTELLKLAQTVAKMAGSHLMNRPGSFTFTEKSSVIDFATQMDQQAEQLIVKKFSPLAQMMGLSLKRERQRAVNLELPG